MAKLRGPRDNNGVLTGTCCNQIYVISFHGCNVVNGCSVWEARAIRDDGGDVVFDPRPMKYECSYERRSAFRFETRCDLGKVGVRVV
jgi:hypothetical protein